MINSPIFIVGCGHSGTTVLLSILAQHSRIYGIPYESNLFGRADAEQLVFVRRFDEETTNAGKARWVEKTPRHIKHIGAIFKKFPDAKVALMMRDGRDVSCSIRARTGDLAAGARRWVQDNAAADDFRSRDDVFEIRYEALVAAPEVVLNRLMSFLDEPFESRLLEHHLSSFRFFGSFDKLKKYEASIQRLENEPDSKSGRAHRLYRSWQAKQPIFDGSGRWRTQLSTEESALLHSIAGDALVKYGYSIASNS